MSASEVQAAVRHAAVTASDTVNIVGGPARALRANVAGNLAVVTADGTAITYAVAAGEVLPIFATRVNATNTTATGIVAWF